MIVMLILTKIMMKLIMVMILQLLCDNYYVIMIPTKIIICSNYIDNDNNDLIIIPVTRIIGMILIMAM